MENTIIQNLLIGLFYASAIGLSILASARLLMKKKSLETLNLDLSKLLFSIYSVYEITDEISKVSDNFAANSLDYTDIQLNGFPNIEQAIVYEKIPYLLATSNYIEKRFNSSNNKLSDTEEDLLNLLSKSEDDKSNIFILACNYLNKQIIFHLKIILKISNHA